MNTPLPSRLVRALGPWTATAIVVGTIIGSGIFKKPAEVSSLVPQFSLAALAWILGGVLALLGSLALAEVAVLYPQAGGNYVYLREGFGRWAGFLWGWVDFWIIRGGSLAALATIFSESLHDVLRILLLDVGSSPHAAILDLWPLKGLTVAVLLGLSLVNIRGVKWGGGLQLAITLIKVGSLLAIMALPILATWWALTPEAAPAAAKLQPVWPDSWSAVNLPNFGTALVGILFAYHGWMNIAPVAEEVKHPARNLPLSLIGGTLIVTFLYLGANLAYNTVLPAAEMGQLIKTGDPTIATVFALRLLGAAGAAAASAAVMASTFGALNGNLLVGPRLLYAMGEDRLAPRFLGEVHPLYRTPAVAIAVTGAWAATLVVAVTALTELSWLPKDANHFDVLTGWAMFGAIAFETLAVATIFVFRRRRPDAERPYRCLGYPVVPLLYVGIMAVVLANMFFTKWEVVRIGLGFIAVGAGVYLLIRRKSEDRSQRSEVRGQK